jgi:hypothetical protein
MLFKIYATFYAETVEHLHTYLCVLHTTVYANAFICHSCRRGLVEKRIRNNMIFFKLSIVRTSVYMYVCT